MATRPARLRSQLPSCYYEGYLEKRSFRDKTSRKLWACLCGDALFFYNDKRDTNYIEKLDLKGLMSVTDDSSQDRNLDAARLTLTMKDGNIKFTIPTAEARELWKGFILSVWELSVPSSLNLLPGQIHMLREAVEKEKERKKNLTTPDDDSNPYVTLKADMPHCYHKVSRLEAELLLEKEAKRGNLILRPSNGNFAITTRQDLDGSVFKHYRVNPFIRSDRENGEKSVQHALPNLVPPSVPPKPGALSVALRTQTAEPEPEPAPASEPEPEPEPEPDLVIEEDSNLYETVEKDKEGEDSSANTLSQLNKSAPKKAIMPPTPAPRKMTSLTLTPSTASSTNNEPRIRTHSDPLAQIVTICETLAQWPIRTSAEPTPHSVPAGWTNARGTETSTHSLFLQ
ncbi:hypothetical protein INR49_028675, partial [Caranx melampygus]